MKRMFLDVVYTLLWTVIVIGLLIGVLFLVQHLRSGGSLFSW